MDDDHVACYGSKMGSRSVLQYLYRRCCEAPCVYVKSFPKASTELIFSSDSTELAFRDRAAVFGSRSFV